MTRSRAVLTLPIVLAIVLIGVFAIRSRGSDDAQLKSTESSDCPPVARADAVATKPGVPIAIDVLANDTDPDGDPLVFQILTTTGGDSGIDDGGTPTDASDDRVLFTPEDPAPASATIHYQALDPQGLVSEATVSVTINDQGALAPSTGSEIVTESGENGRCGTSTATTTTAPGTTLTSGPPFTGSFTTTTKPAASASSKKKSTKQTTTTTKQPSSTPTTQRTTTSRPATTTTQAPTPNPTTTQPPGPPPTAPNNCGPFPSDGTDEEQDAWKACVRQS